MKKLMMTTVAAFGFAALAQADVLNSTGFEKYDSNAFAVNTSDSGISDTGTQYWTGTGDFSQTVLKTYGEDVVKPTKLPDDFETAGDYFLSVDTGNDVMYRKAGKDAGSVDLTQGAVFFDANVKFTASETDVEASDGDKLLVWLKGDEETTNLVVTAGVYDESSESYVATAFTIDGDYSADTWYRLTVKATSVLSGDGEHNTTAFNVYVDEELVTSGDTTEFYSLLGQLDIKSTTLEAAGFQGTGALDNVVWTTTDPFPAEATYKLTLTGADFANEVTLDGDVVEDITNISEDLAVSKKSVEVVVNVGVDDGTFTAQSEDENVTISTPVRSTEEVEEEVEEGVTELVTYYFYTFTVTVEPEAEAEYTIALAFEAGGEEVPTEGEAAAGGSATVQADDEEAAETAVKAQGVDGIVYEASQKYYTKTAVETETAGVFEVTVALDADALEEDVDAAVEAALADVVGNAEEKTIALPAGFYYKIESGSTVDLGTTAKGVSTGAAITMPTLGDDAGFFKVSVDTTDFAE